MATIWTPAAIVAAIRGEVAIQGGDPNGATANLLVATAQQESGLDPSAVGDNGHSIGLFMFNDQGAGAGHTRDWLTNPVNQIANRVSAFLKAGATTGAQAAAIQRPLNPKSYATAVNAKLPAASTLGLTVGTAAMNGALKVNSVVNAAEQFLGIPYLWGGTTTKGFDCSGLVQAAFAAIGVSLPRTSQEQAAATTKISASQAQPGDLVFFDTSSEGANGHVGIYVGNGNMIDAEKTGTNVQVQPVFAGATYRRVTGAPTGGASVAATGAQTADASLLSDIPGVGSAESAISSGVTDIGKYLVLIVLVGAGLALVVIGTIKAAGGGTPIPLPVPI